MAAASSASAEVVDIQWSEDGRFLHSANLAPGKFLELCSRLPAGASARDTLDTLIAQDYCWMWSNKSSEPIILTTTLQR